MAAGVTPAVPYVEQNAIKAQSLAQQRQISGELLTLPLMNFHVWRYVCQVFMGLGSC